MHAAAWASPSHHERPSDDVHDHDPARARVSAKNGVGEELGASYPGFRLLVKAGIMTETVATNPPLDHVPQPYHPDPGHCGSDRRKCIPVVDVVVPVYNEQDDLASSVRRLHSYLGGTFPYSFRITIADNASTDQTLAEDVQICQSAQRLFRPSPWPHDPARGWPHGGANWHS